MSAKHLDWLDRIEPYFDPETLLQDIVGALSDDEARDLFEYILRMEGSNRALDIEIGRRDRYDILFDILDQVFVQAEEDLIESIVRAMSEQQAEEVFEYIIRIHDLSYNDPSLDDMFESIILHENDRMDWLDRIMIYFPGEPKQVLWEIASALPSKEVREISEYILRMENAMGEVELDNVRNSRDMFGDLLDEVFFGNAVALVDEIVRAMSNQQAEMVFKHIIQMHDLARMEPELRDMFESNKEEEVTNTTKLSIYECPYCESEFEAPETLSERVYTCPYCLKETLIEASEDEKLKESLGAKVNDLLSIEYKSDYYNKIYELADELGVPVYYRDMQHIPAGAIEMLLDDIEEINANDPEAIKGVLKDYNLIPKSV